MHNFSIEEITTLMYILIIPKYDIYVYIIYIMQHLPSGNVETH